MSPRSILGVWLAGGVAAIAIACTGDDPELAAKGDAGGGNGDAAQESDGAPIDAGEGDAAKTCKRDDPFEVANILGGVNDGAGLYHPRLTADEREIFYQHGTNAIYYAARSDRSLPFSAGSPIPLSSDASTVLYDPAISGDTLSLYVSIDNRIARLTRTSRTAAFGPPTILYLAADAGLNDQDPHILANESALYFTRQDVNDGGLLQVWRAQGDGDGGFAAPARVQLGSGTHANPWVSEDELEIWIQHGPSATVRRAIRANTGADFPEPTSVDEINTLSSLNGNPRPGWMSPDNCRVYFAAGATNSQIWFAERKPR